MDTVKHGLLYFYNGHFRYSPPGDPPDLIVQALAEHPEGGEAFDKFLADGGAISTENYGSTGEGLDVWRVGPSAWYVEHWDGDGCIDMRILVLTLIDYAVFQAEWLSHMARKIMAEDGYQKWRLEVLYPADADSAVRMN